MRQLLAGLLLLLCGPLQAQTHTSAQPLITGEAAPEHPWMVALLRARYDNPYVGQFCGATLIAPDWVLTAAHCVLEAASGGFTGWDIDVLAGTAELREGFGSRSPVAEIIIHPNFVPPSDTGGFEFDNDIALLRLARPLTGITPVDLPGPEFDVMAVKAGTLATLLGWGALDYDNAAGRADNFPVDLKAISVPIVSGSDCTLVMGSGEVTVNMLCAGKLEAGADSCVGDSGGPLTVPGGGASGFLQVGIISWGMGCALPGFYGVYTRLGRFAQWISAEICGPEQRPPRPRITGLSTAGGRVSLAWDSLPGIGYRVYYRPAATRSPVRYFELGQVAGFSSAAPPGVAYEVAVQSHRGPCNSPFSIIRSFTLP